MNARHLTLLLVLLAAVLAPGCKGRARFKPRGGSFSRPTVRPDLRAPRTLDLDELSPASDPEVDALLRRAAARELERSGLTREFVSALETTIERRCASTRRTRFLEPQGAPLQALFRSLRRATAPSDVSVPPATMVKGLPVQVMVTDLEDARWCVDGDEAMALEVAKTQGPARSALVRVAPGAFLVLTGPGEVPASSALVSDTFLSSLGVSGSLVAFAPTDRAIALAEASKPGAIRAAAKALVGHVDGSGADGVFQSQPLVLTSGVWRPWTPGTVLSEVAALRRVTDELETKMAADVTVDLIELAQASSLLPGAGLPPVDLVDGVKTLRDVDEKRRVRVSVELDAEEAQLIGRADLVRFSSEQGQPLDADWAAFAAAAGARLTPVKLDDAVVPNVYRLAPFFRWPTGAPVRASARAGRRLQAGARE